MMPAAPDLLSGHTVLVTRPAHQSRSLCRRIEAAGGRALAIPALDIRPARDPAKARRQLQELTSADFGVFISVNAVEQALALLGPDGLPDNLRLAAVGRRTAGALRTRGYREIIHPEHRFDSEGLLETAPFQAIAGRTVAVICGEGGRTYLTDTLREAGARVERIEVYRRGRPDTAGPALQDALAEDRVSMIVVSSNAGVENLIVLAGERQRPRLLKRPLVVLSRRTADFARQKGFAAPIEVAANAEEAAVINALGRLARDP